MVEQEINGLAKETIFLTYRPWNENAIPLYTHPAKTLTDEEIIACAQDVKYSELSIAVNDFYILFARAILRKAQEK
jgi:hypothetical protein